MKCEYVVVDLNCYQQLCKWVSFRWLLPIGIGCIVYLLTAVQKKIGDFSSERQFSSVNGTLLIL